MEETIKGIEVIAYKGMEFNMTCKGFHYEIGKSYKTDKAKLCEWGFHACLNPLDVLDYYPKYLSSRYFRVKLSGEITKCSMWDTNVAATEITILEEINIDELLNIAEWCKNENVLDLLYWSDGFARVQRGDRLYNFIDKNGNYLFTKWFYWVDYFHDGFAIVRREDYLMNFIDTKGKILSDEWFYWVDNFDEGFARVKREDDKYNLITEDGKFLSNEWFYWVDNFDEGFARVQRFDNKYNFIDANGKIISDEWFNWVDNFKEGFAIVKRGDGEWAKIDKNGKIVSE